MYVHGYMNQSDAQGCTEGAYAVDPSTVSPLDVNRVTGVNTLNWLIATRR